jgi:hypothetical protein
MAGYQKQNIQHPTPNEEMIGAHTFDQNVRAWQ